MALIAILCLEYNALNREKLLNCKLPVLKTQTNRNVFSRAKFGQLIADWLFGSV